MLVEDGANLYARDVDGKTCLHVALEKQQYSVVGNLLEQDSRDGVIRPTDGLCLLQHLIKTDDVVSISNLKDCEVDLNALCPDGTVLVFFAMKHCKNKALNGLLQAGADPNIQNEDGKFALCEAVEENNTEAARLLIDYGADCHPKDKSIWSPIRLAITNCSLPMLRLLLDSGVDIEQDLGFIGTPLTLACLMGFQEGVELLVKRGANLNACSADGRSCLILALEYMNYSVIDYLLDKDTCEVNAHGRKGLSALHQAVLFNSDNIMHQLIQKKANVNIQNDEGETAVCFAILHHRLSMLAILLEAGADPDIARHDGDVALHQAIKHRDIKAVKLLLQHGVDTDVADRDELSPVELAEALDSCPEEITKCLLAYNLGNQGQEVADPIKRSAKDNEKIFHAEADQILFCPITFEIMKDPVLASDGHTYEREAIERWIKEKKTSPVTRQPMTSATLTPNYSIKHLIAQFAEMDSNL